MAMELEFDYKKAISSIDVYSEDDINKLRLWIQKFDVSKIVPKDLTDKQILLFYNSCYGDVKKTIECLEKYYSCKRNAPEFFDRRVFSDEELKITSETVKFFVNPEKSRDGYGIVYHGFHDYDPSKFYHVTICKLLFMTVDLCLSKHGPLPGYIFLFDTKGVKFGHFTRTNLTALQKFFQFIQEALPVRMKAIHVLNTEPIVDKFLSLMRPLMDSKFLDMIQFHHLNADLDKLYEVIPKSSLPSDYGGALKDTWTLHKQCMEELKNMEPYFNAEEAQRYAAIPDSSGQNTLEGTFRKLDID